MLDSVPHTKIERVVPPVPGRPLSINFGQLGARFPYMTLMRQVDFLEFPANDARP